MRLSWVIVDVRLNNRYGWLHNHYRNHDLPLRGNQYEFNIPEDIWLYANIKLSSLFSISSEQCCIVLACIHCVKFTS